MDYRGRSTLLAWAVVGVAFIGLYWQVFGDLVRAWLADENYSHGPIVVAVMAYLVWARRAHLRTLPVEPWNPGLVVLAASLGLLLVGTAGVEFFLMRLSAVGVVAGSVLYVAGLRWLKALAFPLALSFLVIPLPPVIFYQAAFPLQ